MEVFVALASGSFGIIGVLIGQLGSNRAVARKIKADREDRVRLESRERVVALVSAARAYEEVAGGVAWALRSNAEVGRKQIDHERIGDDVKLANVRLTELQRAATQVQIVGPSWAAGFAAYTMDITISIVEAVGELGHRVDVETVRAADGLLVRFRSDTEAAMALFRDNFEHARSQSWISDYEPNGRPRTVNLQKPPPSN